jgi:hypothetical protein
MWIMEKQIQWPDLSKDSRAVELAKQELSWDGLTAEQKMNDSSTLAQHAQRIKDVG